MGCTGQSVSAALPKSQKRGAQRFYPRRATTVPDEVGEWGYVYCTLGVKLTHCELCWTFTRGWEVWVGHDGSTLKGA